VIWKKKREFGQPACRIWPFIAGGGIGGQGALTRVVFGSAPSFRGQARTCASKPSPLVIGWFAAKASPISPTFAVVMHRIMVGARLQSMDARSLQHAAGAMPNIDKPALRI
jgi:hypothetical protein